MVKGEYYETLTAVIQLCQINQGLTPAAILLGPVEYDEFCLEVSGSLIMGKPIKATKTSIHGIPILLHPTPGVDLAFNVEHKERLLTNVMEQEQTGEV